MMNLGFLASHRGSNMQAVIDACKTGRLRAKPRVVISNNSGSEALAVESLSQRVLQREHSFLVETLEEILSGTIVLPGV
jgi:folate-dependent phosphoribosylglycinamide formyltransferase PurN